MTKSSVEAKFWARNMWTTLVGGNSKRIKGVEELMKLYCNNKTTISIAHDLVQYDRTKHVEVDRHFINEKNW